jgi:NAD(P)-dependent dehydrogenase (short-subunit alcohol dehydrogenase family)
VNNVLQNHTSQLLAGKHALVTGGARGIGAAVTRVLSANGARVTMLGRATQHDAGGLTAELESKKLAYFPADVSNSSIVAQTFEEAQSRFGAIDIVVNNAGQASSAPFLKTTASLWRAMMAVNLDGTFHCMRAALPGMLTAGWGRIVNVASTAGLTGYGYVSAYCSAKHAVIGLTRSVAIEVATKGITVNAVCPGYTDTDMVKDGIANIVAKTGRTHEQVLAEITARNPQKRLIKPEEVAHVVAWLCLPGTESITGQAITISGGEIM